MTINRIVYKYPLLIGETTVVYLPRGCEILDVRAQGVNPCLWALVDSTAETVQRIFRVVATGEPLSVMGTEQLTYVSTFQMLGGQPVFHAFEIIPTVDRNPRGGS